MGRGHARETFKFNQKGKFVKLGESLRAEAKMEELKKRILESAKKAGLESELEDQAKVIKVRWLLLLLGVSYRRNHSPADLSFP